MFVVELESAVEGGNRFELFLLVEPTVEDVVALSPLFKLFEKLIAYSLSNSSCKRRANISSDSLEKEKKK